MKEWGKMKKHNFKSELKGIVGLVKDFIEAAKKYSDFSAKI